MPTEGTTDILDRLDAIEREEHARNAVPPPEEPAPEEAEGVGEGAGGDF